MKARVTIAISDPWDLGESIAWQPVPGTLIELRDDDRGGRALVRLDSPLEYEGMSYAHVVASPRHEGGSLRNVDAGEAVFCGLIGIREQQANSPEALETTGWRGGLGFVGTVQLEADGGAEKRC